MVDSPVVSVLMPARNAELTIGEALKSVMFQSMSDWELLVINDASTDGTETVVLKHAGRDSRIRLLQSNGSGEPAARNVGLDAARGRWIAMLDADDVALPSRLTEQVRFLERSKRLFAAASRAVLFVEPFRPLGISSVAEPRTMSELQTLMKRGHLFVFCHPTLIFDAKRLRAIGGYNEAFFQACDTELVNRALYLHDLPVLLMEKPLTWYRVSPKGMSSQGLVGQRKVLRYLEERNHTWLAGDEPPSLETFLSMPIDFRTRLRWFRHDLGASSYRKAGVLLGQRRPISAGFRLLSAGLLHPRYVLSKVARQRVKGSQIIPSPGNDEKASE
jgi:glycosyltransferase involved in cell wall biosynthesis